MHLWKDAKSQWSHKLKHETSLLLHQWRIWGLMLCAPTLTFFSTLLSPVAKSSSIRLSSITLNSCTLFSVCLPVRKARKCFSEVYREDRSVVISKPGFDVLFACFYLNLFSSVLWIVLPIFAACVVDWNWIWWWVICQLGLLLVVGHFVQPERKRFNLAVSGVWFRVRELSD